MKYFIEWAAAPTNYNPIQTLRVDTLEAILEINDSYKPRVGFTSFGQVHHRVPQGHLVFKVYRDTETQREVIYKDGGFGANHISPTLQGLIKPALPEVLV